MSALCGRAMGSESSMYTFYHFPMGIGYRQECAI